MAKIIPPTNCPSCGTELTIKNAQLFCKNKECETKLEQKIKHFASVVKIKGLGPVAISKLDLLDISQIYQLTEEQISEKLNSSRLAEKLMYEIENSKKASLNLLLPAFSIPLIGKVAAEKLSNVCNSIYDINEDICKSAGLGPKCVENLMFWLKTEFPHVKDLPFSYTFDKPQKQEVKGVVCITGKLKTYVSKAIAKDVLEEAGYKVVDNLTKEVTVLVNESGVSSAKTEKASSTGIKIVTNIKELIGD